MSYEAFATKRTGQQDRAIDRLHPLASEWLGQFENDEALGALLDAATDVWLDTFETSAPEAYIDVAVGSFRELIGDALRQTTPPDSPPAESQVRRVAVWLSTVATNDATWQGFQASGGLRMRWVSRKDERVRTSHRAANGQIRSVLGSFDVGGAELRYPGDPRGPLNEVMECRCVLAPAGRVRTRRNSMTAAGDFDDRPFALITLLPSEDDPVNVASSEDIAHMTFIWFGDADEALDQIDDWEQVKSNLAGYAGGTTPITVPVRERGVLGDDEADVLFLEPTESLLALRDGLMVDGTEIRLMHDAVEQYPEWTPHVTLGYPEAPALAEYDGAEIIFDRFALWIGNERTEFPMGKTAIAASAAVDIETEDPDLEIPEDIDIEDEPFVDEPLIEIPVHGVATISGKPTGDGREFAAGGVTNRPLPLPIRYEFVGTHGGDTSHVAPVGRIDELWEQQMDGYTEHRFRGVIITTKAYANEAIEGIADGSLRGVSVETDDISIDVEEERERFIAQIKSDNELRAGVPEAVEASEKQAVDMTDEEIESLVDAFIGDGKQPVTRFSSARICGFTIVPIPAFHEGYIALGEAFEDELSDEDREALVACGCYQPDDGDDASVIRGEDAFDSMLEPGDSVYFGTDLAYAPVDARDRIQRWEAAVEEFREVSGEERKRLAEKGNALPDGSFPIANEDDLRNAIQAIGRAKDPDAAKAHIKKRARALGHPELIPEDWASSIEALTEDDIEKLRVRRDATTDPVQHALFARAVEARERFLAQPVIAAAFAPGTKDGPGWVTNPRATARIRRYWTHGKGAAKIKWGAPGDFNRCRTQLAKYVQNPDWLAGLCANMHKEVLGFWPAQHHGLTASAERRPTSIDPMLTLVEVEPVALVAGASWPEAFDAELFQNPNLTEETPITFDGDRVYGHIATWDACHIGMDGLCQNPPASGTDYAYFRKGVLDTTEGPIRVGALTFGTGHIGIRANAAQATAHYDKPNAVRAYVVVGEDAVGIWFSGVVKPGLRKDDIAEFRALGAISGDWRWVKGNLELVGCTAVNTNGFQLARTTALVAAAGGHQITLIPPPVVRHQIQLPDMANGDGLVASAGITVTPADIAAMARVAAQEVLHQQEIAPRVAEVRSAREELRTRRIEAIRQGGK